MALIEKAIPLGGIKVEELCEALKYSDVVLTEGMTSAEAIAAISKEYGVPKTLYEFGKEHEDVTGGWVMSGNNASKQAASLYLRGGNDKSSYAETVNLIDLTEVQAVRFHTYNNTSGRAYVGVKSAEGTRTKDALSGTGIKTTDYDVSELSGGYYVFAETFAYSGYSSDANVLKVELIY